MMIVMRDCISVDSMIPDFLIKTFSTKKFRFKQVYSGQSKYVWSKFKTQPLEWVLSEHKMLMSWTAGCPASNNTRGGINPRLKTSNPDRRLLVHEPKKSRICAGSFQILSANLPISWNGFAANIERALWSYIGLWRLERRGERFKVFFQPFRMCCVESILKSLVVVLIHLIFETTSSQLYTVSRSKGYHQ